MGKRGDQPKVSHNIFGHCNGILKQKYTSKSLGNVTWGKRL